MFGRIPFTALYDVKLPGIDTMVAEKMAWRIEELHKMLKIGATVQMI